MLHSLLEGSSLPFLQKRLDPPCRIIVRVLSSGGGGGGGGGSFSPKIFSFPPKTFCNNYCLILKCVILSKILVECYMKTAKNVQCAFMHQHFSTKPKFLEPKAPRGHVTSRLLKS